VAYVIEIIILIIGVGKYLNISLSDIKKDRLFVRNMFLYYLSALGIKTVVLILLNFDTILMKMLFAENEVGYYSSAMVIAKIGMYVTTALIVPLFPMAVQSKCSGENPKPLLLKCMIYSVGFNIVYSVAVLLFGRNIILLLYGESYLSATDLFIYVFPYVIGLSCIMILMNYFLALNKGNFFTAVLGVAIGAIVLIGLAIDLEMTTLVVIMDTILAVAILICLGYAVVKN
jgi:O-antigen/teichoic acid export membrane protein